MESLSARDVELCGGRRIRGTTNISIFKKTLYYNLGGLDVL